MNGIVYFAQEQTLKARNRQVKTADLKSYVRSRIEGLSARIIDSTEELRSQRSVQEDCRFEDDIERRLHNGAKFIP